MDRNVKILSVIGVVAIVILAAFGIAVIVNNGSSATYTVTYDYNYEGSPDAVELKCKANEKAPLPETPELRNDGYYFVTWCEDKACTKEVQFPYTVTKNVTFYGKWCNMALAQYFNPDYMTETVIGQAYAKLIKPTTGATELTFDGKAFNGKIVNAGYTIAVVDTGTDKYNVVDLVSKKTLFTIPSGASYVQVYDLNESDVEFLYTMYDNDYEMYDMYGNVFGSELTAPEMIMADTILFGDKYYRFTSDNKIELAFEHTDSTHTPNGGNGKLYYEMVVVNDNGVKKCTEINILDSKFKVVNTIKMPELCEYFSCTPLVSGNILVQYAYEVPQDQKYTFKEQITERRFIMDSFIVGENSSEEIDIQNVIYKSNDICNSPEINWEMFSHGTIAIAEMGIVTDSGILIDEYLDARMSVEGYSYTVLYNVGINPLIDPAENLDFVDNTHLMAHIKGIVGTTPVDYWSLIDGSTTNFTEVIKDVANPDGVKYFIKAYREGTTTDNNIYDVNGNKVGTYGTNMKFFGTSHNNLFFYEGTETEGKITVEKMYVYDGGNAPRLITDNAANSKYTLIGINWYAYYNGADFIVCAENGTEICKIAKDPASMQDEQGNRTIVVNGDITVDGTTILNVLDKTTGMNKYYELTTN